MAWLPLCKAVGALGLTAGQIKGRADRGRIPTVFDPGHATRRLFWTGSGPPTEPPAAQDEGRGETPEPEADDAALQQDGESWVDEGDYTFDKATGTYKTFIRCRRAWLATSKAQHAAILSAYSNFDRAPQSLNQIARRLGWGRPVVRDYLKAHKITHDCMPLAAEELDELSDEEAAEVINTRAKRFGRVEVLAQKQRLREVERDADHWRHFKATVEPVVKRVVERALASLADPAPLVDLEPPRRPFAVVGGITDLHWGAHGNPTETGSARWDREQAARWVEESTNDALAKIAQRGKPEAIYVLGPSDFYHVDMNKAPSTTKGTGQDVDGSVVSIHETGLEVFVRYLRQLARVAPVVVLPAPGNHDNKAAQWTVMALRLAEEFGAPWRVLGGLGKRTYTEVLGLPVMATHRDCGHGSVGSTARLEDEGDWLRVQQRHSGSTAEHGLVVGGHVHHLWLKEHRGILHVGLGAGAGQDAYHADNGWHHSRPSQDFVVIEQGRGATDLLRAITRLDLAA